MQRGDFSPNSTAGDAFQAFVVDRGGDSPQQRIIQDEHGFTLNQRLLQAPLSALSSRCCLNLAFVRERVHSNGYLGGVAKVTGKTVEDGKNAAGRALSFLGLQTKQKSD